MQLMVMLHDIKQMLGAAHFALLVCNERRTTSVLLT